jgi:hypothetical protein
MLLHNFVCLLSIYLATCSGLDSPYQVRYFLWKAIINVSANLSVVNQELQAFTKFTYVNIYCI